MRGLSSGARAVLGTWSAFLLLATALQPAEASARRDDNEIVSEVGPVTMSENGRRNVRGQRPDGASVHVTYLARAHMPQAQAYHDLQQFEQSRFSAVPQTIVDQPPEPWMAALTLPDLPIRWNTRLVEYLRYFRDNPRGQNLIRGWIARMGRYEHILAPILREVGVPEDLMFVAMAESGFNPSVRSRVGATGMWQFMGGTGQVYGLHQDYWIDERRDIERATYAAAAYLKDLRVRFGSWEMALAAFNAGYALAMKSISRYNTNNFWALCEIESGLPYATTNYIPKIMAAAIVGRNRAAFGVDDASIKRYAPAKWVTVQIPGGVDLDTVAKGIGADKDLLHELNAQLIRGRTPPGGYYPVRVPEDKLAAFQQHSKRWRQQAKAYRSHIVRTGESLAKLARSYRTTIREIRRLNGLHDSAELVAGVTVLIPPAKGGKSEPAPERPLAAVPKVDLGPGERLVFLVATRATTPRSLSETFKLPWERIVELNDLDPQARVQEDQVLQFVVDSNFSPEAARAVVYEQNEVEYVIRGSREHIEASLRRRGLVRRAYKARRGESLEKIAKKFKLTVGDLCRINQVKRSHKPERGELIVVYVEKNRTKGTVAAKPPAPTTSSSQVAATKMPSTTSQPQATKSSRPTSKKSRRTPSTAKTNRLPGRRHKSP